MNLYRLYDFVRCHPISVSVPTNKLFSLLNLTVESNAVSFKRTLLFLRIDDAM